LEKIPEEDLMEMFAEFYSINSKNQQDSFLQGLMEIKPIERRRPKEGTPENQTKGKRHSIFYHLSDRGENIQVCKNAILKLYSITSKRLRRISDLLSEGKTPKDLRGKNPKGNAIPVTTCQKMKDHIECFPTKISHYTGKPITYLSSDLNIKTMHKLFKAEHPGIKCEYSTYYTFYKENYNYRFGRPQKDVCGNCEELNTKLKSNTLNDNAKRAAAAEKMIHVRRAEKFYSALKEITKKCEDETDTYGICVDYMQNLPLPHIPVQEIFYYRQLWVNCFCVYDLKTKKSTTYLYHEGIAKKGGNEVSSFIHHYMKNHIPESAKEIHVFSDGCTGQNRNHTVLRFLLAVSFEKKITVKQYYPVRGHSFLPCDRTFGVIKRAIKSKDRVYTPEEYEKLIKEGSNGKIETILLTDSEIILDFDKWWPTYFKKTVTSTETIRIQKKDRQQFKISKFYYFEMREGTVTGSTFINGLTKSTFHLKKPNTEIIPFPSEKAFRDKNPINRKKIEDIRKVLKYVTEECKPFYDTIMDWPTTAQDDLE
jgi:hypothetical protein